jgi:hypothetical protein
MKSSISTGGHEVILSGSLISFGPEPIEIKLSEEKDPLTFIFRFVNDENVNNLGIIYKNIGNKTLEILLNKYDNVTGAGDVAPTRLGHIDKRPLLFSFRVFTIAAETAGRLFHYTFYLGKETEANG